MFLFSTVYISGNKQMSWSQIQVQLLIDLYKIHPCLYAVKHKDYKNKHARNNALSEICKEVSQIRPGTGMAEIKNKFNNVRTNFMAQYRKYSSCFHSGMSEDEIYKPNIWYFDAMMSIVEHTTPREAVDSIGASSKLTEESIQTDAEESQDNSYSMNDSDMYLEDNTVSELNRDNTKGNHLVPSQGDGNEQTICSNMFPPGNIGKKKSKKRKPEEHDVIEAATSSLRGIREALSGNSNHLAKIKRTQSEIFGDFVAKQLSYIQQCGEEQFIDVQHEISQVLYNARKKCLEKTNNTL